MIPSILSRQIHHGLKDFLSTTFLSTNPFFHGMLDRFLNRDGSLCKGPYISLQLPFLQGKSDEFFPEIPLGYTPYQHQEQAFARLSGPDLRGAIIATGTGSGKTECFTQPILEYCRINSDKPGIKAILIYPMNALAFDQAGRLAAAIWNTPSLRGQVTAGLYVGQGSSDPCPVMRRDSIITDKEIMRQSPPHILLTNYKMLDYLLLRAGDAVIWESNAPETLRFIVVDELHTFDGAQGTDLACLLRRLKSRLKTPEDCLCPVGTSATLGGDQTQKQLLSYAQKIFGQSFDADAVITESRQSADDFLRGALISMVDIPGVDQKKALSQEEYANPLDFLQAQIQLWTGMDILPDPDDNDWRIKLGHALKGHVFVHNLLRVVDGQVRSMNHIISELGGKASPQLKAGGEEYAHLLINSILACISAARSLDNGVLKPFIHVRVQHWFRELRRMVCSVNSSPELVFADDLTEEQRSGHLPLLHCRECGQTGWIGKLPIHGSNVQTELKNIYIDFFRKKPSQRLISMFPEEQGSKSASFPGFRMCICPSCLQLGRKHRGPCNGCGQKDIIPVLVPELPGKHCPSCGAHNSLTLLGSRAASLTSVMIGQLMASRYNTDSKCITFSDNVQDAAHRAGFFGARTFRFTFRAALQQFIQEQTKEMPLDQAARQMSEYWRSKMDAERFAATFLPPNMAWFQDVDHLEKHDHLPPNSDLCSLISRRLSFETVSEYGFGCRIGRTLEKSGASVAGPRPAVLNKSLDLMREALPNEIEELRDVSLDSLPAFILGLITQMKNQGGIIHPDLNEYVKNWGKEYMISQRRRLWMPSFGPKTRTPGFVTTRPGIGRFPQLTRSGSRSSWYEWWAYNYFPVLAMRMPTQAQRFYSIVFACMKKQGLVQDIFQDSHHIYGLEPGSLLISSQVMQFKCKICGHSISGAEADSLIWDGMLCLRRGCRGTYESAGTGPDYYGRLYSLGRITRLVAREHTGLLERDVREDLERKFKTPDEHRKPWYPNLLSSTPTLEMGIDIGDLSTTLQCSVPPNQANYIQRIGRSGRKDGNGLNLTVAAGKAHDLYFFAEPLEMIAGDIHPPGIFLNASAVLERQLTAFCLDRWVLAYPGADPMPRLLGTVLDTFQRQDKSIFPHNLMDFVQARLDELTADFLQLFDQELSQDSTDHLKQFALGDNNNNPGFIYRIVQRLYELQRERKSLKLRVDRLYREIKRKANSPVKDKNHEQEMESLRQERSGLMALIRNINSKNTLNFLTDEGLLPNYAFPEQGILLQSIIYRKRMIRQNSQGKYETLNFEYERPAASGLRELAPGNRFYAEGRRVEVDQVDLSVADVETWRLCSNCPHAEPEATVKSRSMCPRCGSPLWSDQGRKQELIRIRQVMANAPDWETRIADDSDERNPAFYTTQLLVDVDDSSIHDAFQIDNPECPFGFEFISKALFRDINFGPMVGNGQTLQVAGEDLERTGFVLCRRCGKVQKPDGRIKHAFGCPAREKDDDANFVQSVFLYREFTSEAVKILVPVSGYEISRLRMDSFVAALQLGLKHHFGGSAYAIQHLQTTLSQEPVPDSNLRKQYIVLYDTVPGGTGFLKQLMRSENMLKVLSKALEVLINCSCQKDPDKDGCYNCLLAYRHSHLMPTTSRNTAVNILKNILAHAHNLRQVPDLRGIRVEGLGESELEALFLEGLAKLTKQAYTVDLRKEVVRGKPGSFLRLNGQVYEIEPQVEMGTGRGIIIPSRADFIIRPARSRQAGKPVVVFTDGFTFHRKRIGQDTAQRMAILQSKNFYVWSLSWKDVYSQIKNSGNKIADLLHPGESIMGQQQFSSLLDKLSLEGSRDRHLRDNFGLLADYLSKPEDVNMQNYALAQALSLLDLQVYKDASRRKDWLKDLSRVCPDYLFQDISADFDQMLLGKLNTGPIEMFIAAQTEALKRCDAQGLRIVCCLDDEQTALEQEDFERSWINYLRLMNIFQFLPGSFFVTRTGLRQGMYLNLKTQDPESDPLVIHTAGPDDKDHAWQEVFELADPAGHKLLRDLRSKKITPPDVGFELVVNNSVAAQAEFAWPKDKSAYFFKTQQSDAAFFQENGWQVHIIE